MPGDGNLEPFIKLLHFSKIQEIKGLFRVILDSPEGKISKLLVARAGLDPATNGL
jgi:hypothetical protein